MTVYFLIILFAVWWATTTIRYHLDRTVFLIREQRNEDLRWHRDSLLSAVAHACGTGQRTLTGPLLKRGRSSVLVTPTKQAAKIGRLAVSKRMGLGPRIGGLLMIPT